ncbi:trypsin-like peptidase domain-containing protein [Streptomyces sp. NPDC051452]|uniref:trypsin-like peptidase domain-containing protein n=1 Tax=Streptomyces sp. NPDC051452 TaxID=3365654 RepID=UPI003796A541
MNEGNPVPPENGPAGAAGTPAADVSEGSARDAAGAIPADVSKGARRDVSAATAVDVSEGAAPPDAGPAGFEPARPATPLVPRARPESGTVSPVGDFELARPAPAEAFGTPRTEPGTGAAEEGHGSGHTAGAAPVERPKPLHDPDPYGTPPYGEPGPWAPAPPVQHPSAAPAPGTTALPAGPTPPPPPVGTAPAHRPLPPMPSAAAGSASGVPSAPSAVTPEPAHGTATPRPGAPTPGHAGPLPLSPAPEPAPVAPVPEPAPARQDQGRPGWRYDPWAAGTPTEQALGWGPSRQGGVAGAAVARRGLRGRRPGPAWTLLVAVVAATVGGVVGAYVERAGLADEVRLPGAGSVPAGRAPDSVAGIAARAMPSVVTLHVTGTDEAGTGTGFVLDGQGHILTNNHVVAPAGSDGRISVTFSSGDTVRAEVVGRDSGYDLAVVQVHGVHGLTPLPLGNSDDVEVGDPVVAIGAPFDLANTVTSGIISAKERPITAGGEGNAGGDVSYVDALQTDAPINPGNSGGPLLDSRARVIGINSAIRSADAGSGSETEGGQAGSIGLGFAIPVNQARRVAEELIDDGHATHPVIGVRLDTRYTGDGARIDGEGADGGPAVLKGGPGERAGLRPGDVITAVGADRVHSGAELIVRIRAHRPGDRLRLTVERGGTERKIPLVLGTSAQN